MRPDSSIDHLHIILGALPENGTLLEIGSGWSTVWFAERLTPEQHLVAVEHDPEWWGKIIPLVAKNHQVEYLLREREMKEGPPVSYGQYGTAHRENPAGLSEYIHAFPYTEADVILIDGIARGACLAAALCFAEGGSHVFLHDAERRSWYDWSWEFAGPTVEMIIHPPGVGHPAEMLECAI